MDCGQKGIFPLKRPTLLFVGELALGRAWKNRVGSRELRSHSHFN
jgi:hypothetical protein